MNIGKTTIINFQIYACLLVVGLFIFATNAFSHPLNCGDDPSTITGIITYDTNATNSYCELCGIGQVRLVVTNPSHGDMSDFVVRHDFLSSGLEYVPGSTIGGGDPAINGTELTWTAAEIPGLALIDGTNGGNHNFNDVVIIFQVRSISGTEEDLVTANRNVSATTDYQFCPATTNVAANASTGQFELPLNEPQPTVTKLGRNVDANQDDGSYSNTVYGNINDDVIWRIEIANNGLADLQDLKFNDLMQDNNFLIEYACPSESDADTYATTGAVGNCTNTGISNSITDFLVDNPFGNMGVSADGREIDVTAGGSAFIYLVGKITDSCVSNKTNTVSNVEWGCEVITPDGGITQTSANVSAGTSTTTLSSFVTNSGLQIQRDLTGLNTAQDVGSRGLMTITIDNQTGGSVKNIKLRNILPPEYVIDSTYIPTIAVTPAYGTYDGMVDTISWTNPQANTVPLISPPDPSADPLDPLANTAPEFDLLSSTVHLDYPDQVNMLRHDDVAVITFRVVMIEPTYFDNNANIDVREENTGDTTDPINSTSLNNRLYVTFEDFCNVSPVVVQQADTYPYNDNFPSDPEDIDIDITGTELIFILTNDPTQPLPLQVTLTNNGGHYADNYFAYITFGATMEVVTAPAGCSATTNPPPLEVWDDPADLPATATVYECGSAALGTIPPDPLQPLLLDFEVIKTNDPVRLAEDDLSFRADVIGEITLSDGTPLWFPDPANLPIVNRANNYSLDSVRARVIGFNLTKNQLGNCTENNPPPTNPDSLVQIGEECTVRIDTGGWFGFQTPGFTYIAVQRIQVVDELPNGQSYISSTDPTLSSSATIAGISLNPAALAPLDEGWFNWTFNQAVPGERITVKDQWFSVDATTRILNKPIDTRAAPNVHAAQSRNVLNSTFEAVFNNALTGLEEVFSLGENTIGYPSEPVRRVDLTVTEPSIRVTKELCNETLYGTGPACTNFVNLADDGDTQDSYIYRITLRNRASGSGIGRAPAYDITATDILDVSDLVLIESFNTDGLDNDADGLIDGADGDGEGTISDNIISNATPATITFSHTHSSGLLRLNAGSSVRFYYRVDPDDEVSPLQQLNNSVTVDYDSLEGDSGNQSVVLSANSELAGARVYGSAPTNATLQILPLQTQPKQITRLSNTAISGVQPQAVSVGEEIEYRLRTLIPVANLREFIIRDELPAGISCIEAPVVDLDAAPYSDAGFFPGGQFTPTCTNNLVYWDFGNQVLTAATSNNLFNFPVTFIARVENTATVNDSDIISNGSPSTNAYVSYINESAVQIINNYNNFDVVVNEPDIALTKTFESVSNDAADVITVTVTATNNGTATAYNLRVLDDLAAVANLTFLNNVGGTDPPDNIDTTTLGANRPIFSWAQINPNFAIAPAQTISFTFDILVEDGVQPDERLDNTIQASWTSLPDQSTALNASGLIGADGSSTGMRIGALPNAGDLINDHESSASTFSTVPGLSISKNDLSPAVLPEVGAHKNFEVVINLPEGITNNLIVNDELIRSGLSYVLSNNANFDISYSFTDIVSINGLAPSEAAFNSFPADATAGNAIWNIGTVVTPTEDDTTGVPSLNPSIRINYYARINNDINTNSGSDLQNYVTTSYTHGEDASTVMLTDDTPQITVTEAVLNVNKTDTLITAAPITGGDIIEYTVTVSNSGNATAYDVNVVDTLSAGLQLDTGFTPTATIDGSAVAGFVTTPQNAPAGPLIWGRDNADDNLDIPAGSTLVLTYRALINTDAEANTNLSNSVLIDWTSLDGNSSYERTGMGCPTITAPNDYCVGPASTTVTIADTNSFNKTVVADSYLPVNDATLRIGDTVTYRLSLNLQEGTTRAVNIQDALPVGLAFVDIVSINGDSTADYSAPGTGVGSNFSYATITSAALPAAGQTGNLSFTLGSVANDPLGDATTDNFVIIYRARVIEDTLSHVPTTTLTNTATLNYIDGAGLSVVDPVRLQSIASITVLQPVMTIPTKIDRSGRTSITNVFVATDIMNFRLSSCNTTGLSPAYSLHITDVLATQMDESSIAGPINGAAQPDVYINGVLAVAGVDYNYTAPAIRGGSMLFDIITAVNPAQCVEIDYDIGFYTDFGINQNWDNTVVVDEYWSLDLQSGQRYASLGPTTYTMTNNDPYLPPEKILLLPASAEATIGENVTYRITIPASNAARFDIVVSDLLDSSLEYLSATEVSGNGFVLTDNSIAPNDVNLSVDFVPAGQDLVIDVLARVANNSSANAGVNFNNTIIYTHSDSPGGPTILAGNAITTTPLTIIEPLMTASKAVNNITNPGNLPIAGDILRYTLTFNAAGTGAGDNYSDVYDVSILDQLSLGLSYQAGSSSVSGTGNTITDPIITGDGVNSTQSLNWNLADTTADIDIVEGSSVTVNYDVLVLDTVLVNQPLTNTVTAQWTGLNDINANERNGTGTPVVNDYVTTTASTIAAADYTALVKTRINDTYNSADDNVRIGDIVQYELRLGLQQGLTNNVVLIDTLPRGIVFEGVVQINADTTSPFSSAAPYTYNDVTAVSTGDPAIEPTTVEFVFGDVSNVADGDNGNDEIIIVYTARILNEVLTQVDSLTLVNNAQLNYLTYTGTENRTSSANITVLQPILNVTKTAVPAGGDSIVDANELVTYTVDIVNTGLAPVYDAIIADVIPQGMRNGTATITPVSTTLVNANINLPNIDPLYFVNTGLAVWNFDTAVANTYNIPAGETLRLVYQVQVDADVGAGLPLINQANVREYFSLDDEDIPVIDSVNGVREIYGPSNTATSTLTTSAPGTLLKENPADLTVSIGETFSYTITVPELPIDTNLYDVRILDDLSASAADLTYVSVSKISGTLDWTPVNTGTDTDLVIEDITTGIDIPAGEQIVIRVTVQVEDTPTNVSGLAFNNTANYTYNQLPDEVVTQQVTAVYTTPDMTIVGPDELTMEKTGPVEMRKGIPGVFTLNVQNIGTAPAWDITITDILPNYSPQPGGMCDVAPDNVTAQIFLADGVTPVSAVLVQDTDYIVNFVSTPDTDCVLTITMQSADAVLAEDNRLIVTYQASLDLDTSPSASLINIAGLTEWFSGDTDGTGAKGAIRTYTETLTDGTVDTLDHEDAYTVAIDTPVVLVQKRVMNVTTGQDPGSDASPGDVLRYSIFIQNQSDLYINDFRFEDDLDVLNNVPVFVAGSLNLITTPTGADASFTDANGGTHGTGLVDIRDLALDVAGSDGDTVNIEFEVTLVSSIANGTVVLNQGYMRSIELYLPTDDPNINGNDDPTISGDENSTETLISSAAQFEVFKTSEDMTDDPDVLVSGDILRYTITVKNIGNEDTVNTILSDQLPANTTYVANSTTLNGVAIVDAVEDVLPLLDGLSINAPNTTTVGHMPADADADANNVATITFDVLINADLLNGTIISNQAYVNAEGAGSPSLPETPSDDPDTIPVGDPTRDVIGNQPLIEAYKIVNIEVDNSTPGILDPGDILRYTIIISNIGASEATNVTFADAVPDNTTYIADSVTLNGLPVAQPDNGVSPLEAGIDVSSSDLVSSTVIPIPPLPTAGNGVITAGESAIITFNVQVDTDVDVGTVISNQGSVESFELPTELTDSDGNDLNGDQPTLIVVGNAQLLSITKDVSVVGGGPILAGGQLEYRIRVINIGLVPAMTIVITDDLDLPIAGQMTYVDGSGLLNGLSNGVSYTAPVLTADYGTNYGSLEPGESAELRFLVDVNNTLPMGTTITNIAQVYWNSDLQSDSASVSIDVGGTPGVGNMNGTLWHDANFNNLLDDNELVLSGWNVDVLRDGQLLGTQVSDENGVYQVNGLIPNDVGNEQYELRFSAPTATNTTALLGLADSPSAYNFTNELQRITDIILRSGTNAQNLNLPIEPNGVVYNSILRTPIVGATVSLLNAGSGVELSSSCFDDANQQNQVTLENGYYKFDLNFTQPGCSPDGNYLIRITPPATDYLDQVSQVIPPQTDASTGSFNVPACSGAVDDVVLATADYCEVQPSEFAPAVTVAARAAETNYYLHLRLDNAQLPGDSQVFNNHLPIDPILTGAVAVTKVTPMVNVTRSQLVPYTITVTNTLPVPLVASNIIDSFPAGFKYVEGSARLNDAAVEPTRSGLQLVWENIDLAPEETQTLKILLIVGAAVNEGEYVNRAEVFDTQTNGAASGVATATVRVIPDPAFDCSDVIGKVFDDKNLNAYQDEDEKGLAGIRVVSARGLTATSDKHGRFHVTCAVVPDESRGSNFIMKVDERTLPTGYRMTTENPRVLRATRGKMLKFAFGATIHRVVSMDLANDVFVANSDEVHALWRPRLDLLMEHLQKAPSILHLSYLADTEKAGLVEDRLEKLIDEITKKWEEHNQYRLVIETEIFWRRGGPPDRGGFD